MGAKFNTRGVRIPLTEIKAEPNIVLKLSEEKVLLGFGQKRKTKKTEKKLAETAGFTPLRIREAKLDSNENLPKEGEKITVSIFEAGDLVKVTGQTKGRGFAGGIKRWGFSGGPKTHGQSDRHRAPGSIGSGTTPGRVYKGKKMAGHMGVAKHTTINLEVIEVDEKNNVLLVKGAIPGPKNGLVIVKKIGKVKNFVPYKEEVQQATEQQAPQEAQPANTPDEITNTQEQNQSEEKSATQTQTQTPTEPKANAESENVQENGDKKEEAK